jgi:hypothetical protein
MKLPYAKTDQVWTCFRQSSNQFKSLDSVVLVGTLKMAFITLVIIWAFGEEQFQMQKLAYPCA